MVALLWIAAVVAVASTVMVITRVNAIHALLYLIVSLLSVAVVFLILGAPFVAALEVIVYAGAIMVLFVFVVMLLNLGPQAIEQESSWLQRRMWIGPGLLSLVLIVVLVSAMSAGGTNPVGEQIVGPKQVGIALFGPYLIGVELAGMMLLAGLVGAFHIGRPEPRKDEAARPAREEGA